MQSNKYSAITLLNLSIIFLALFVGHPAYAADNCSSYLRLLSRYQTDYKEFLACGIPADNVFMRVNLDEEKKWCEQATQKALDQRFNQAGLPTLHCGGALHYFSIKSDAALSQRLGLINALYESVTPEPVSKDILATILANPGAKTGTNFTAFPVQDLKGASPTCRLYGVKTALSTEPDRSHWLVTADIPCQRDELSQSPIWVVEEKGGKYRVLLAYRSELLTVKSKRIDRYAQVMTSHNLDDGNNVEIVWRYDKSEGRYRYLSSTCSNVSRINNDEPLFIDGCYQGETW